MSDRAKKQLVLFSLIAILLIILLHLFKMQPFLRYDRALIEQGELWRVVSGSFVHYNWRHLWLNLAGLLLGMSLLAFRYSIWQWFLLTLLCALAVGLGLYFFTPEVRNYVGLSGALHGILVAGALMEWRYNRNLAAGLFLFIAGKLFYEQLVGPLSAPVAAHVQVAVNAHLFGALAGLLAGGWFLIRTD